MDGDGVPCLLMTLLAIDSDAITVGCLRMDVGCCCCMDAVGDVTITRGGEPASKGISLLLLMSNCTLGVASTSTLGGAQSAPLEVHQCAPLENGPGWAIGSQGGVHW